VSAAPAALTSAATTAGRHAPARTEILWDTWGVPHIFAHDEPGLFRAFGWAQMENHADLLLRLYGQARGRAAEYWGPAYVASDTTARTFDFAGQAHRWYAQQRPAFQVDLTAFAAGINAYARAHPDRLAPDVRQVLPVGPYDVLAHTQRLFYSFLANTSGCGAVAPTGATAGSNGWAIGPAHAAGGHAMLLANPHLLWSDLDTLMEAQLTGPGINAYGAALVGIPVLAIAFNDHLGWMHTVSSLNGCTLYRLVRAGPWYRFDGRLHPFITRRDSLLVRQPNGTLRRQTLVMRRSIQGPVVEVGGQSVAIRMVGIDVLPAYGVLQEWWDLARARTLVQFQQILRRLQVPLFTVIYADRDGHIMSLFNGEVPVRPRGDAAYWAGLVPGDTSRTLWTTIYPYDALPRVIDPPAGWVQNSNNPPWWTTYPPALNPATFPASLAPQFLALREQYAIQMLMQQQHISFAQLIRDKFSSHMALADRVLPDLLAAARAYGTPLAKRAAAVLVRWDRAADAGSRGAVLFFEWTVLLVQHGGAGGMDAAIMGAPGSFFRIPWSAQQPLTTPRGLAAPRAAAAALDQAARTLLRQAGALDVPWGQVFRLRRGAIDLPASGGFSDPWGIFRAVEFAFPTPDRDGRYASVGGDSFIAAVRFTTPLQARVLLTYGNASQPGSPHIGDQLRLYAHNQLRPAWRTPAEIAAHLSLREEV
jgi:acyl-homoserine-lactone acylase